MVTSAGFYAVIFSLCIYVFIRDWIIFRLTRIFIVKAIGEDLAKYELPATKRHYEDLDSYLCDTLEDDAVAPKAKFTPVLSPDV